MVPRCTFFIFLVLIHFDHSSCLSTSLKHFISESWQKHANLNLKLSNKVTPHERLLGKLSLNNDFQEESNLPGNRSNRRRKILNQCIISAISTLATPTKSMATVSTESIRKAASNIPGYGVADVHYPDYFLGKWLATRSTISSNQAVDTVLYPVRFLSNEDNLIIADRGYNLKSQLQNDKNQKSNTINAVQWESSNPNVLTVQYANGSFLENKVTKRLVEDKSPDYFLSSEFYRVSQIPMSGMPAISAQRVLTKWRKKPLNDEDYVIEGMELVYDPTDTSSPSGRLLSKSLIRLERDSSSR